MNISSKIAWPDPKPTLSKGVEKLDKKAFGYGSEEGAVNFWQRQVESYELWLLDYTPTLPTQLPPPNTQCGSVAFSYEHDGIATKSYADANTIKAYNGASPYYISWIDSSTLDPEAYHWSINNTNSLGFDYVARVCDEN